MQSLKNVQLKPEKEENRFKKIKQQGTNAMNRKQLPIMLTLTQLQQ